MLIKTALCHESTSSQLLIINNADNMELLFGNTNTIPLYDYLPFSQKGSILFTTQNYEAIRRVDILERNIIIIVKINRAKTIKLLERNLKESQIYNIKSIISLLSFLAYLPLAIKQASTYMASKQILTSKYFEFCQSRDKDIINLLSRDFIDQH